MGPEGSPSVTAAPVAEAPRERLSRAESLGLRHRAVSTPGHHFLRSRHVDELHDALVAVRERCRRAGSEDPSARLAGDWLLDNDFLILRVLGQLRRELPAGFQRRLPRLTAGGRVRVLELAEALYREAPRELELDEMEAFLTAYQRLAPLTIAELWALPALLRLVILTQLVESLGFVGQGQPSRHPNGLGAVAGRAIRSLRLLAEIHWKEVFSRHSATDHALRADPAGAYTEMDFETRDGYRRAVEELASAAGRTETEVAEAAVARAAEQCSGERGHHVGHHLVGDGRRAFERAVGARIRSVERLIHDHPRAAFFGALALAQIAVLVPVALYMVWVGASAAVIALALVLSWIPASVPAGNAVRWLFARAVRPRPLPKLDFSRGIPAEWRTLVAVPTLLGDRQQIERVVQRLEIHYLSNRDPSLRFALLTDHPDSDRPPSEREEGEHAARLEHAVECVRRLNARHGAPESRPFHLLHREPRWNPAERKWMGWERKRGKIEELNRYLLGEGDTTYALHAGDSEGLRDVVFVLTLDSDTQLPADGAARLVGALAHPLNRPEVDADGRVRSGYTVLQPRVEISPASAGRTLFSRQFSGETGIDIYTRAVSETYQDLFGEGIYVGKGIYDVDAFRRSLRDRVPENALLSHDLFEGLHGRAGLVTDVVVYEDYPADYPAYLGRLHRWIRGDWQLLPWLAGRVPVATGGRARNRLDLVDRFKILDNIRRSVVWASVVALLAAGWSFLPGHPLFWTLAALSASGAAAVSSWVRQGLRARQELGRWLLGISFAPLEAVAALDAIVRVLVRMTLTRRRLLEWTTAEEAAKRLGEASRGRYFAHLWPGPVLAAAIALALALISWGALAWASPILVLWLLSPEIAWRVSRPAPPMDEELAPAELLRLRLVARRTWLFFETFVGPTDNWLPIDHYQERPRGIVAHRTSPTNIGMLLVSQLAAYDLGYLGPKALASWASNTLDTLEKLERFRGHIYNWYDTRTLEPLEPRYVSTVDSGNLAGALLTLAIGCEQAAERPADEERLRYGFRDTATLLLDAIELWATPAGTGRSANEAASPSLTRQARDLVDVLEEAPLGGRPLFEEVRERLRGIEAGLLLALRDAPAEAHDPTALRELRLWLVALSRQLSDAAREGEAAPESPAEASMAGARLRSVAQRARALVDGMDLAFLYDPERRFFHIGYNATVDRLDPHHYDLLASEARLASFLALIRGEAPLEHWFALGRPLMSGGRQSRTLLSWGGSMFEYLMPRLFMRSHPNTLLTASYRAAVDRQIEYGRSLGVPWGISESGYALLDGLQQYQYRAFGVPGLGMRRGLEEDVVVAPYASMLALPVRPREVVRNLEALEALGALGPLGFYEAVDFHPRRAPGRRPAVVRSYMAHHHGMSLTAIANFVTGDRMVDRFHSDPLVRSGELLLDEHIPPEVAAERPTHVPPGSTDRGLVAHATPAWQPEMGVPQIWAVGNGSLTSFVTTAGGGGVRRRGIAISRWDPDPLSELCCRRVYVLDRESGEVFDVAPDAARSVEQDAHVLFEAGQIELRHRRMGLSLRLRVTVTPSDDVEIQEVEIANESRRVRSLSVVGCLEPLIAPEAEAERHPAFSKMFLRCTPLPEIAGALAMRLGREAHLAPRVVFRMAAEPKAEPHLLTVDRGHFLGRNGSVQRPAVLGSDAPPPEGTLDPICACATDLTVEPGDRATVVLITAVADRGSEATEMAVRFGTPNAVRWAFEDADKSAARRIERMGVHPRVLPAAQRLLSALLVPDEFHRAPAAVLAQGRPSPPRLWGRGVSGDEPIVVVSLDRTQPTELLPDVLAAHRYIHSLGIRFDLVLVDRAPTTYADVGLEELRRLLAKHEAAGLLRQRGGVHVIQADHVTEQDLTDLAAAALVYLDASAGSLEQQMGRRRERPAELPLLEPVGPPPEAAPDPEVDLEVPPLFLDNELGGFAAGEYVLRPQARPPAPWCNVIANERFGCLVSEASMGSSWSLNAGENRLTPWHNDPVLDPPSEVLYLRDEETGRVWSATPQPVGPPALVRHGQGYTRYRSAYAGLEHELTVFVPPHEPVKVVTLFIRNAASRPRRLTATYYAEWVLGTRPSVTRAYVLPDVSTSDSCLLAETPWSIDFSRRFAFLASDRPLHGYTADRAEMLGDGGLRDPAGLRRWGLSGRIRPGLDPCGALQVHIDLQPEQSMELAFFVGQAADRKGALDVVRRLRRPGGVAEAWAACRAFWDDLLGSVRFETPDPALDQIANRWLPYQTISSRFFGRTGFYQSSGAYGYRDQLQDSLLLLHCAPALARSHLLECAARQFEEGDVLHWWHPPSGAGVRTRCSDDLLWLVYVTYDYVRATGDSDVLLERVPFLVGEPLSVAEHSRFATYAQGESATLLEHCRRALSRGFTEGPHGIPLIGDGDWNDGMDAVGREGRGESIWLGWFVHACTERFASLLECMGADDEANTWRRRLPALRSALHEHGWDGRWYRRAYYDDGTPIGAAEGEPPEIDSIAQSWAVLSGAGQPAHMDVALDSVEDRLVKERERLVLLLTPPFRPHGHDPGYIAAYPPGVRENGGQYTHAGAWVGLAHAERGDGHAAYRIASLLNPLERTRNRDEVERYRVEPYVIAADIYGVPPFVGRGGWTWYTGSAAWIWRLTVEGILGLRRHGGALDVEPCLPGNWPGFEAWVRAGSARVHVRVHNEGSGRGVSRVSLDGRHVERARVDLSLPGERSLEVWVGSSPV